MFLSDRTSNTFPLNFKKNSPGILLYQFFTILTLFITGYSYPPSSFLKILSELSCNHNFKVPILWILRQTARWSVPLYFSTLWVPSSDILHDIWPLNDKPLTFCTSSCKSSRIPYLILPVVCTSCLSIVWILN